MEDMEVPIHSLRAIAHSSLIFKPARPHFPLLPRQTSLPPSLPPSLSPSLPRIPPHLLPSLSPLAFPPLLRRRQRQCVKTYPSLNTLSTDANALPASIPRSFLVGVPPPPTLVLPPRACHPFPPSQRPFPPTYVSCTIATRASQERFYNSTVNVLADTLALPSYPP